MFDKEKPCKGLHSLYLTRKSKLLFLKRKYRRILSLNFRKIKQLEKEAKIVDEI